MGGTRVTVETAVAHSFVCTGDAIILARSAGAMLTQSGCKVVESKDFDSGQLANTDGA